MNAIDPLIQLLMKIKSCSIYKVPTNVQKQYHPNLYKYQLMCLSQNNKVALSFIALQLLQFITFI